MDIEDDDEEQEASQSFSQISLESPSRSEESIIEISSDSNTEQSFPSTRGQKRKTRPDQEKVPSPASKQSHRISLAEAPSPEPVPLVQNYLNEVSSAQEGIPGVPGHKEWIPTSAVATHLVCPECKINVTVALMKNHLSSYLHEKSAERIYIGGWVAYKCGHYNSLVYVSLERCISSLSLFRPDSFLRNISKEVTFVSRTQPLGPFCLRQCLMICKCCSAVYVSVR